MAFNFRNALITWLLVIGLMAPSSLRAVAHLWRYRGHGHRP